MPGRTVKNAPYSAELVTETTQTLADGNHIKRTTTSRFFRDSEGRTRREQSLDSVSSLAPNANVPKNAVFINDPVAGVNLALNPSDRTALRSRSPRSMAGAIGRGRGPEGRQGRSGPPPQQAGSLDAAGRGMRRRNNENVKTEDLGTQVIEGVAAQGTRTTMTIPAGQIGNEQAIQVVNETWYSPDLQTVVRSHRIDPRNGEVTFKLNNVSRAEPARSLFEAPADYSVTEQAHRGPVAQ